MVRKCKTCGLADQKILKCRRFGHDINPNEDFCSKHTYDTTQCCICGNIVLPQSSIIDDNRVFCGECYNRLDTCATCKSSRTCKFETDPSTLPKMVQQQIRQGPMTTVTQIMNPERVAITCQNDCSCYDLEKGCLRHFNCCDKYEVIK